MVFSIAPVLTNDSIFLRCVLNLIVYRFVDCTFNLKSNILKEEREKKKKENVLITRTKFFKMKCKVKRYILPFLVFFFSFF